MCTVSIVPREDGFRLVCNRDEQRARPAALPPRWTEVDGVRAGFPIDPLGRGTWLAVSGQGLTVVLLNRQGPDAGERRAARRSRRSRGEIPLALVAAGSTAGARHALVRLNPADYPPFQVVVVWFEQLLVGSSDGGRLLLSMERLAGPVAFTSSSLGDREAERLRLPLFRRLVVGATDPWSGQRAFHDHRWTSQPEFSVRMMRADARTVSRTRIEVRRHRVALDYEPLSPVTQ